MYLSNNEKIEIVFFYKPVDLNFQQQEFVKYALNFRTAMIENEFHEIRNNQEKIKIYIMTPKQFLDNHKRIKVYFDKFYHGMIYGIVLIDEYENPPTVISHKKVNKLRDDFKIILELKVPYTRNEIANELVIAIEYMCLYSNKNLFEDFLSLREIESKAMNDISKAMIIRSEFSSENLVHLVLKKSIEISASDAGFVILKEDLFKSKKNSNKETKEVVRFQQFSKITQNQNINLITEFLEQEKCQFLNYIIQHSGGLAWHETEEEVSIDEKNQFVMEDIPEFTYDKQTYKIKSYCAFPIRKPGSEVEGFIILFNKKISKYILLDSILDIDNNVVPYSSHELNLLESLANQAGVAFAHAQLIGDLRNAFESFTAASITAIESRDPSTKGHSERVATLTVGLAESMNKTYTGIFGGLNFTRLQIEEIRYASLLHDFGKIGVREHVLQKEKKLFPHQLEKIETRFNTIKDKLYINILEKYIEKLMLKNEVPDKVTLEKYKQELYKVSEELDNFWKIILELNEPSVINREIFDKISEIAAMQVMVGDQGMTIIDPKEIQVLSIKRGSLSVQERVEIESHVTHSYNFLVQIPWTQEFKNIPEIVFGHHERLDGSGYPRKLIAKDIPVQAKMMAITDVFDALVAQDRPYKKAMPFERALQILEEEVKIGKLDRDLFKLFVDAKIFDLIKKTCVDMKVA